MRPHTTSLPWRMPLTLCDINPLFWLFVRRFDTSHERSRIFSTSELHLQGPAKHAQTSRKWRKHVTSRNKVDNRGAEAQASAVEREGVCLDIPSRGRHCPKM